MSDPANDNPPPRRRLVPLIGTIEDGRFTAYKVVELLPHPDDLVDLAPAEVS